MKQLKSQCAQLRKFADVASADVEWSDYFDKNVILAYLSNPWHLNDTTQFHIAKVKEGYRIILLAIKFKKHTVECTEFDANKIVEAMRWMSAEHFNLGDR